MSDSQNISVRRGDTNTIYVSVTRTDPVTLGVAPVNLTSAKVWFTAKRRRGDADSAAVIRKGNTGTGFTGITVTDATNGKVSIVLDPSDTTGLESDLVYLYYDVQTFELSPPPNGTYTTVASGQLLVSDDVTRAS